MKKKLLLTLALAIVSSAVLSAQGVVATGRVFDAANGEPLIGATIVEGDGPNAATTSADGSFRLNVKAGAVLNISYIGYKDVSVKATDSKELIVALQTDATSLEEIIVVGYGTQKAKDMTAPIASVKGTDLSRQVAANPMSALQGMMSGVQITQSGAPGSGPSVKIRGIGSIGDYANPLYVVDGVFVDNIDFLSSSDIESLTVLKDASAAAIYGVRAANGVVLVTTRKGTFGTTNVSYEGYAGLQVPTNIMKLANTAQYVELINFANQNTPGFTQIDAAKYTGDTDWYAELVRTAITHSHSVDLSGANERTNYSVGINYFMQDGIMNYSTNDYERVNFRMRLDQKVYSWLNVGVNNVLSNYTRHNAATSAYFQAFVNPPVYNVFNDANTVAYPVRFDSPQLYGFGNSYGNPVASAYYNNSREKGMKDVFSAYAEVQVVPEKLKFRTSYNIDFAFWDQQNYSPESFTGGSQGSSVSSLAKTYGYRTNQIIDNLLTYSDRIDSHSFSLMAGQSTRMYYMGWLKGTVLNVPGYDDQSQYLVNGSYKNQTATDGATRYNGLSFFTRGTYNFDDRYLATVTFRADGSSKYQQKWGFFPSVGLGWNLTREAFMQSQSLFQNLKLRASWGMLGNDNVPANSAVTLGSTGVGASGVFGDTLFDGQGAQTVVQNYLKWEVVDEINVGFDFSMLDSRLNGSLDYYNRTTSNVVFYVPIATGGGTANLLANNGKVRNQGIELTIDWNERLTDDFGYNISFNATTISNKVIELEGREYIPGGLVRGNYSTRTQVGLPIGAFWGYEIDGVYTSESDALKDPVSQTIKDAGYFKYRDQNGDKVIDENDKVCLGSAIPSLILGLNLGLNYKNLDFMVLLNAQIGNKILNAKRMNRDVFVDGNYDLDFYTNAWRSDKKSNTYPSPQAYNSSFIQQANSFFVEDGSYLRVQNVQLGYTLHNVIGSKSIRFYLSAQRPLTLFGYNGFTTEIGGSPTESGIDTSVYPMQSIYTAGINVNF